ncbi:MAG: hypothetical protein FWF41_05740 [Betaproteobacteria bacterium]|nr:hypothetical protein [Betaproteobacteria bacterium]
MIFFSFKEALMDSVRPKLVEGQTALRYELRPFDFAQVQPERLRMVRRILTPLSLAGEGGTFTPEGIIES